MIDKQDIEIVETVLFSKTIGDFVIEPNRMVDFVGGSCCKETLGKITPINVADGIIGSKPHTSTLPCRRSLVVVTGRDLSQQSADSLRFREHAASETNMVMGPILQKGCLYMLSIGLHHKPKSRPRILTKTIRVLSSDDSRMPSFVSPERVVASILLSAVRLNVTGRSAEEKMCCGCWIFVVEGMQLMGSEIVHQVGHKGWALFSVGFFKLWVWPR